MVMPDHAGGSVAGAVGEGDIDAARRRVRRPAGILVGEVLDEVGDLRRGDAAVERDDQRRARKAFFLGGEGADDGAAVDDPAGVGEVDRAGEGDAERVLG